MPHDGLPVGAGAAKPWKPTIDDDGDGDDDADDGDDVDDNVDDDDVENLQRRS